MKTFMSAALQETEKPQAKAPNGATECNSCNNGPVRTAGQESVDAPPPKDAAPAAKNENAVVVMQGPLGVAITEALNKSLSKKALEAPVQVPGIGLEAHANNYVQANGQITDPRALINKISKSVGLVPATDEEPTTINTLIDCASKVDDIEFIMVEQITPNPSVQQIPQKSYLHAVNMDGVPANEQYAVESVQVIVNYRKR